MGWGIDRKKDERVASVAECSAFIRRNGGFFISQKMVRYEKFSTAMTIYCNTIFSNTQNDIGRNSK